MLNMALAPLLRTPRSALEPHTSAKDFNSLVLTELANTTTIVLTLGDV